MDAGKLPPRASARIYHEGVPQRDTVSDTLTYTLHQTYVGIPTLHTSRTCSPANSGGFTFHRHPETSVVVPGT